MTDAYARVRFKEGGAAVTERLRDCPHATWRGQPLLELEPGTEWPADQIMAEDGLESTDGLFKVDPDDSACLLLAEAKSQEVAIDRVWVLGGEALSIVHEEDEPLRAWWDRMRDRKRGHLQDFRRLETSTGSRLIYLGSFSAWLQEMRERDADQRRQKERKAQRVLETHVQQLHDGGHAFINPYTFVPLPEKVRREKPTGHARGVPGNYTGHVDVKISLATRMMLAGDWNTEVQQPPAQMVRIPGSSIRGSVRNLYEVITESCLSIIEPDYVPVHRSNLNSHPPGVIAVVTQVESNGQNKAGAGQTGRPIELELTEEPVWVRADRLRSVLGGAQALRSGVRVTVAGVEKRKYGKTAERMEGTQVSRGDDWVVHVVDAGTKGEYPADHVYCVTGRLTGRRVTVPSEVWEKYRDLCKGSQDVKRGQLATNAPAWDSPDWPGEMVIHVKEGRKTPIGCRRRADGALAVGDTVWVTHKDGKKATGLRLAASWREHGRHSIRERLPHESLLPCSSADDLCPACAMFGFINPNRKDDGEQARQQAYASHVRFGHLQTTAEVVPEREVPPPMRSPRPSAGNFYLDHTQGAQPPTEPCWEAGKTELGHSQAKWGSAADSPLRKIAGRKFYWHGQEADSARPTPRHKRRDHQKEADQARSEEQREKPRWFLPAGTELAGRVYFENVTAQQLQWLLAALAPQRLLADGERVDGPLLTHIGGGKGLGYGSAAVELADLAVFPADSRYLERHAEADASDILRQRPAIARDAAWLPGLLKVLSRGAVPADRIWYPTREDFRTRAGNEEKFDASHRFFALFSGASKEQGVEQRMRTLPPVDSPIQYISNEPTQ